MRQQICLVIYDRFTETLINTFGEGIFSVVIEKLNNSYKQKTFYVEYENATEEQINQVIKLAKQDNALELQNIKQRVVDKCNYAMNKLINTNIKDEISSEDSTQASNWLQNQQQQCPICVISFALKNSLTNVEAAQNLVKEQIKNTNYVNTLTQICNETIIFVSQCQTAEDAIEKIQLNIEAMRNLDY